MNALVEAGNGWLWKQLIFEASHVFFFSLFFPQKATTSLTFGKLPFVHFLSFSPPQPLSQVTEGLILALGWMSPL